MSNSYPVGEAVQFTAGADNAEGQLIPGWTGTVTWTASSGSVAVDSTTLVATVTGATVGELTVTGTDASGITGTDTVSIIDTTAVSLSITDAAAPAATPAPAAA